MKISLTENQKQELENQHKLERDGKVRDRIKAVLLADEKWPQVQISQALRIDESTVHHHLKDYLSSQKLKSKSGGSESKLNEKQTDELIKHLDANTYPSTREIIKYVFQKYNVKYCQQGMHCWLKAHKFSYKKPKGFPLKENAEQQAAFINEYKELKNTLKDGEKIMFFDSVHPTEATKISSGWIRTGVEKMIATVARRDRVNITGAIDLSSMTVVSKDYETINGVSTVEFLKLIDASDPNTSTFHLIADGGSAHKCHEVGVYLGWKDPTNRQYLEDHYDLKLPSKCRILTKKMIKKLRKIASEDPTLFIDLAILNKHKINTQELLNALRETERHKRIVLHILPSYSPKLNPIERLWKVMNEQVRNNTVFTSFKEFKSKILDFFDSKWDAISDEFRSRINDNFEIIKPAF
jgi:transposase